MKAVFPYLNNKVNLKMSQGLHPFYMVLNQEKKLEKKNYFKEPKNSSWNHIRL